MLSFEETEAAINKTRSNLEDALDRRDYAAAAKIQRKLDGFVATRDYLIEQSKIHDNTSELNRLELQRQHEEDELKERMSQRMDRLLREYKIRLEQMERRHADEIARVDRKYSDIRYGYPVDISTGKERANGTGENAFCPEKNPFGKHFPR